MKRWISLILTAALCTSMCCIYAEDAVLGTSDEAQSIVLQEDSSQTTEVGSVSVPEDEASRRICRRTLLGRKSRRKNRILLPFSQRRKNN